MSRSSTSGRPPYDAPAAKRGAALVAVCSNGLLVALKLGVGIRIGSISVLSEAAHSATDLIASAIALISVSASDTPPDEEHPYGHGKVESVSAFVEALLVLVAAIYVIVEAAARLHAISAGRGAPLRPGAGLVVMAVSAATSLLVARHVEGVGRRTDSPALAADAQHIRSDVITSAGVFAGLALVKITDAAWIDPLLALVVAALILRISYRLATNAIAPLMDARLPATEVASIERVLQCDQRVMGYHKLRTRKAGSQRHADVHVQMQDDIPLVDAHALAEELEDRIRDALPGIHVNIHIEPYQAELRHQQEAHGVVNQDSSEE